MSRLTRKLEETRGSIIEAMYKMMYHSSKNLLTIHSGKCKIMTVSRNKFIGPLPQVTINGKHVEVVNSRKCLSITIDHNLSWETHTSNVCKSFSEKVKRLYNMRSMSNSTLSTIYYHLLSTVLPSTVLSSTVLSSGIYSIVI